jgi:hypothetical protein
MDPAPWFLDGPGSGALEWPETGDDEVDDGGDKERMMRHRLPEIEITGRDGRAVCQCRAADDARTPDARDERRSREERRGEERRRSREGIPEAIAAERDEQDDECGGERRARGGK